MTNNLLLLSPIRSVAQLVEQLTLNQRALGSNPSRPTTIKKPFALCRWFFLFATIFLSVFPLPMVFNRFAAKEFLLKLF